MQEISLLEAHAHVYDRLRVAAVCQNRELQVLVYRSPTAGYVGVARDYPDLTEIGESAIDALDRIETATRTAAMVAGETAGDKQEVAA